MPKQRTGRAALVDHDETAWRAEHRRRAESEEVYYEAPPLPAWTATEHVTRELFGRFVYDRDANLVHDVQAARPECRVDDIAHATFYHFLSELPDAPDCSHCIGAAR